MCRPDLLVTDLCTRPPHISGTGFIQADEFLELIRVKMQEDEDERELKEIFRVLDKDKRGEVGIK